VRRLGGGKVSFDSLMTGRRFFHILSLYAGGPTFLTTGNGPALLKASFLVGRSKLMFEPSTYMRSPSLYSMSFPRFSSFSSSLPQGLFHFSCCFSYPLDELIYFCNSLYRFPPSLWIFGGLPRFTKNGDLPVLKCCLLLCTKSAIGSYSAELSC